MWKYIVTDKPTRSLLDDQSFFGEAPGRLQEIAGEAERRFEHEGIRCGDALIALGNAYAIHASSAKEALSAFEKALAIYSFVLPNGAQVADAHHRIAMVLRRLADHGQAAEHLAKAIKVWEENGTAEEQFVERWRQESKELRSIHRNSQERRVPPG